MSPSSAGPRRPGPQLCTSAAPTILRGPGHRLKEHQMPVNAPNGFEPHPDVGEAALTSETWKMEDETFDPDLIHAIFKHIWTRRSIERERNGGNDAMDSEQVGAGTSKKNRPTSANAHALKLSCELLRLFVAEAVNRAALIAEAEGVTKIEATHLERILPQLLLDF